MTHKKISRRAFLRSGALTAASLAMGCAAPQAPAEREPSTTATEIPPTATTEAPVTTKAAATATVEATATETARPTETATMAAEPTATMTAEPTATAAASEATPTPSPTATAVPTTAPPTPTIAPPTSTPTIAPPTPTVAAAAPGWQDLVTRYPQAGQSIVSVVQHDGVWDGDQILENVVLHMLDAAMVQLTGLSDAAAAWKALFDPGEQIGIKVNTISRYTTTPTVAYAVARRLQEAGVPGEQIVIFDRSDRELAARGFQVNPDGAGVRCRGPKGWADTASVAGTSQQIHDVLASCDALINMPALKMHGEAGFTSALKNHYGSINRPASLHGGYCDPGIAALNDLPVIREKTRLIVGDILRSCPYTWSQMSKENVIATSFDPVAHDTVARQILIDRRGADGRPADDIVQKGIHVETAFDLGLGADAAHSEVRRTKLG